MSTAESERARSEELSVRASTSADRARFWAGLNRHPSADAKDQHRAAQEDDEGERGAQDSIDDSSAPGEVRHS